MRVEIQIRTEEMDRIAELGVAAHWRYKNEAYGFDAEQSASKGLDARAAVQSLLDIADHGGDADEYLEHAKLDMYQDHVFAFTPKGKLIALPQGASPLDFAYAVHSDIGDGRSARGLAAKSGRCAPCCAMAMSWTFSLRITPRPCRAGRRSRAQAARAPRSAGLNASSAAKNSSGSAAN